MTYDNRIAYFDRKQVYLTHTLISIHSLYTESPQSWIENQ